MNLPIAERELRIASRTPRTYRGRLVACVIFGCITGWIFWFSMRVGQIATIAPQTYAFIAHMALLMCMFSVGFTSDAISSEKRNGTLGLLFLTDLKARDVVFGKLAAFGLVAFYGLIAIIPILTIPVLMGGISGESIFRTAITLLNALFLSLSIGLWISARSWEQKRAMNGAVWIVIALMWLVPAISGALTFRYPQFAEFANCLYMLSPMYQQSHASPFGIGMRTEKFWESVTITHVMAWLALWRACAILPRAWQDRAIMSARGRLKKIWEELRYGSSSARAALRDRLLRINAVHWLSSRERTAPINAWLFVVLVLIGWVGLWGFFQWKVGNGPPFLLLGMPSCMILYLGMRIRTCSLAGEVIARDRFSGALELLLSTTLTERDVARGQWLTFRRTLLGPAVATILVGAGLFLMGYTENGNDNNRADMIFVFLGLVTVFIADLIAAVWTGMWTACFSRTQVAAPGQAIIRLLLLPWGIFVTVMTIGVWLKIGRNWEFPNVFTMWWFINIGNNVFWSMWSHRKFHLHLRQAAAERYQPSAAGRSWWNVFSWFKPSVQEIRLSKAA